MSRRSSHRSCFLAVVLIIGALILGCQTANGSDAISTIEQLAGTLSEEAESWWHAAAGALLPGEPGPVESVSMGEPQMGQAAPDSEPLAGHTRYASLSDTEKSVYDAILSGLRDFDDTITFSAAGVDTDRLGAILYDVLFDNPDIFWASSSASWELGMGVLAVHPVYYYGRADAEAMQASIDATVDAITSQDLAGADTDADKALALAEWICASMTYNAQDAESMQNIDSVFSRHVSVCAGYAKAYSYLLTKCGISNLVITGTATDSDGSTGPHAWVLADLDGTLTYIEPTWMDGDGMVLLEYFGMSDEECSRMHTADGGNDLAGLEAVSDHIASYVASADTYSRDWAASCIHDAASQGSSFASFVLEDAASHDALVADMQGTLMSDALAGTEYGSQTSYQYVDNETMHAVTLIFGSAD